MQQFIHVDQSLCSVGGHEYDCAVNTLRAAQASGYRAILAANRRFRHHSELPRDWPVYPVFPHKAYSRHCLAFGRRDHHPLDLEGKPLPVTASGVGAEARPAATAGKPVAVAGLFTQMARRRQVHRFALACHRLFSQVALSEGDQVFLATLTEFDLLGLTRYLVHHAESRAADWHLQFHFDLFAGCRSNSPMYESRRGSLQSQFTYLFDQLADHRIHLYNTTEKLTAQYDQLGVASFQHLTYPVNPALLGWTRPASQPLRVTCAGGMRREKGFREIEAIVESVRQDPFFDRKIEVTAQAGKRKQRRLRAMSKTSAHDRAEVRVTGLLHPLRPEAYYDLIRETDIALFLHDAQRYALQCSSVLQEMLAAGKPVIVLAASWLAEQIEESIFAHVETMRRSLPIVSHLQGGEIRWMNTSGAQFPQAGTVDRPGLPDNPHAVAEVDVPPTATDLVLSFRRKTPAAGDDYVLVQTEQFDCRGLVVDRFESIVGGRVAEQTVPVLCHLSPRATRIAVRFRGAKHDRPAEISGLELDFLDASGSGGCPAGSVGLIAARPALVPAMLRDMVAHYDHYRATAERFSLGLIETRHPVRTVQVLTKNSARARAAKTRERGARVGVALPGAIESTVAGGSSPDQKGILPSRRDQRGRQAA